MRPWYVVPFILLISIGLFAGVRTKSGPSSVRRQPAHKPASTTSAPCDGLRIVHPSENAHLPALASTFVFGSANPDGKLVINGFPVPVHPGGGFLAMVKLSSGPFTITAELTTAATTYTACRKITVAAPPEVSPVTPLTIDYIRPDRDLELLPGDEVVVTCKGSPGMKAFFTVEKISGRFPMLETNASPGGIYKGSFIIGDNDRLKGSKIRVTLANPKNGKKISKMSAGGVSLFRRDVPVMAEVTAENAKLFAGPSASQEDNAGYILFPPRGTRLQISGKRETEFRVQLTRTREAWVRQGDVRLLPVGTPLARGRAGSIAITGDQRSSLIWVPLGLKVPFEVRADATGTAIDILFFGVTSNTDWMTYTSTGPVEQVQWFQDDPDTYRVHVQLNRKWWGYDAQFEDSTFVLEVRCPPARLNKELPLKGIVVAVDAGHSADTGAIGPTGLVEKDANLALARRLKEKLNNAGARVIMTRRGTESVSLFDRPKIAWGSGADLFISMHNNALPDGEDPFRKNGYGVYYYHPMSFALAREVHAAYSEKIGAGSKFGLRDDGLHYGNLALPRTTQMPSVLTESAYIIVPQEEAFLKTDTFQSSCADAVVRGIKRYLASVVSPAKPAAKSRR